MLEDVLARHRSRLLAHARRHSRRPADAEEALQSACLLFLERFDDRHDPLGWLHTTVKREAWALARRAHRRRESGFGDFVAEGGSPCDLAELLPSERPQPEELSERRDELARIAAALARLKPDEREALILLGLGCSYREIMARQGWTYAKVNRCLSKGRAALRELVAEGGESPPPRP